MTGPRHQIDRFLLFGEVFADTDNPGNVPMEGRVKMNEQEQPKVRKSSKSAIRSATAWKGYTPAKGLRVVVRPERRGESGPKGETGEIVSSHEMAGTPYFSICFDGRDKANRPVSLATLKHFYYPESFWKQHLRQVEAQKMAAVGPVPERVSPRAGSDAPESGAGSAEKLVRAIWALESTVRSLEKAIGVLTGTASTLDVNLNAALVAHGKGIQDSALQVATSLDELKNLVGKGDSK